MNEDNRELSFKEVTEKYPDFPRIIIRKIDTAVRGVFLTEKAQERAKEEGAFYDVSADLACLPTRQAGKTSHPPFLLSHLCLRHLCRHHRCRQESRGGISDKPVLLFGAVFRDGTWVLGLETYLQQLPYKVIRKGDPYVLDVVDGKLWLLDGSEPVEEIHFVPIPKYYGKKTSRGTLMSEVVTSRFSNSLAVTVLHCHYLGRKKIPCKYCIYGGRFFRHKEENNTPESLEDIYETVNEALEEEGRWTGIHLVGGSDPRGNLPYEKEVEEDIKILKTLQRCFGTLAGQAEKIPVRAIASAFPKEQLLRLKEAGLSTYNSHIEVWDKKLFEWICPGKAKYFGRQYWIDSILSAVEIFGRGNVSTQLVAGAELAKPYGFKTIEEALESNLEGVEFFAGYGVYATFCILLVGQGSVFYAQKQKLPPLEYYVRLTKGIDEIRRKYRLSVGFEDYRCPNVDLARLDYNF